MLDSKNGGFVTLNRLTCLPPDIKKIESLGGSGFLFSKSLFGGWANKWKGQIKGIDPDLLINKMIELGLFYKKY